MKATAKCPKCGEVLTEDCIGCISGGNALHSCKGKERDIIDVKWKIIDCTKKESEELRRLGFKGKIPEPFE